MNKKVIKFCALLICFIMVLTSAVPTFADVSSVDYASHWAKEAIEEAIASGMINGYPDGTFKPDNSISRAEFLTIVNNSYHFSEEEARNYSDVKSEDWYAKEVAKATAAGYLDVAEKGAVEPNRAITREEVATMISKVNGLHANCLDSEYTDIESAEKCNRNAIIALKEKGIMQGMPDGSFAPLGNLTRAEAVTTMIRTLAYVPAENFVYDEAKVYGNETETTVVDGNVVVTKSGAILRNMVINGDLIIDESVAFGDVTLESVAVKGAAFIYGGGKNSIHFNDVQVNLVYVFRTGGEVRLVASGMTSIHDVVVESLVKLEEEGLNPNAEGFERVLIEKLQEEGQKVGLTLVHADCMELDIEAEGVDVELDARSRVQSLITGAPDSRILGRGTVVRANIMFAGAYFEKEPLQITIAQGVDEPTIQQPEPVRWYPSGGGATPAQPAVTESTVVRNGTGGERCLFDEETRTFSGTIDYYEQGDNNNPPTAGNYVGVMVTAPADVTVDQTKASFRYTTQAGEEMTLVNGDTSWMDGDNFVYYYPKVTELPASFTFHIDWDGAGTAYAEETITISVAADAILQAGPEEPAAVESIVERTSTGGTNSTFDEATLTFGGTIDYYEAGVDGNPPTAGNYVGVTVTAPADVTVDQTKASFRYTTQAGEEMTLVNGDTSWMDGDNFVYYYPKVTETRRSFTIYIDWDGAGTAYAEETITISVAADAVLQAGPEKVTSLSAAAPTADGVGTGETNIDKYEVGQVTGSAPDFETVIKGTEDLVNVQSANAAQGEAQWVGVLISTERQADTLAVKTPGMESFYNLQQTDVDEAAAGGATGTQTFVWWLKAESIGQGQRILIKVQGEEDSTAVALTVKYDAYVAPIQTESTVEKNGTGGEFCLFDEETRTFSGTIDYYEQGDNNPPTAGNYVGVTVTAPADVTVDQTKASFRYTTQAGEEMTLVNGDTSWMDGDNFVYYYPKVTETRRSFTIYIDWDGAGTAYAEETITISVAADAILQAGPEKVTSLSAAAPTADGVGTGETNIDKYEVGQVTGSAPDFETVIKGTEDLVNVQSANAAQGEAQWVGVLISTERQADTLAVKTPGMESFYNLQQTDVDEAAAGGATGTQTFVWWLKAESIGQGQRILIKVQGEEDSTAVALTVKYDAYVAPIQTESTVEKNGTGGEFCLFDEETRTFSGTIDYYEQGDNNPPTAGNYVGVTVTAPADVTVDQTKASFRYTTQAGEEMTLVNGDTSWMDGDNFVYYYPKVTETRRSFTIYIDWDGAGTAYAEETITISVAADAILQAGPEKVTSLSAAAPTADGVGTGETNIDKYEVGQVTGSAPDFETVIKGTEDLVNVQSANAAQGEAQWVGVLISTERQADTLAVKTPGMESFYNLQQTDVDEAAAGGATGTQTFVWWLKAESIGQGQRILIKVQGEEDSTAVALTVKYDAYVAPIQTESTVEKNGTGGELCLFDEETRTFSGTIDYYEQGDNNPPTAGNYVGVTVTAPADVTVDQTKASFRYTTQAGEEMTLVNGDTSWMDGDNFVYYYPKVTETRRSFTIYIDWDGAGTAYAEETITISVAADAILQAGPEKVTSLSAAAPTADGVGTGETNIDKYEVGQVTGSAPDFETVIKGTEDLVNVQSANAAQGEAQWVGVLISTERQADTLAVKTPGMESFYNLQQTDVDEAAAGGATGTQTFVWWLKAESIGQGQRILIKVQGEEDGTAVALTVKYDAYVAPIQTESTVEKNGTGGELCLFDEETRTFSGTIDYYEQGDNNPPTAGNYVGVKITAPAEVTVDQEKVTFRYTTQAGEEMTLVNGDTSWMDGDNFVYYYPKVTETRRSFTIYIDWDGAGTAYAEETITINVAADAILQAALEEPDARIKAETPNVTGDDESNMVTGMENGMEYNYDNAGYIPYEETEFGVLDFSGDHTLLVRLAETEEYLASDAVTLTFHTNLPDKTALANKISEANTLKSNVEVSLDGTDVAPGTEWVTQEVKDAFVSAIASAKEVLDDQAASQDMIDQAVAELETETNTFDQAKADGTNVQVPESGEGEAES